MTALEANILRALTAYKIERGMSKSAAATWAQANLQKGLTQWRRARAKTSAQDREFDGDAYDALKAWAQAQAQ